MNVLSKRIIYLLGFLLITGLIATSLYLQKYDGLDPCPLCILQRFTMALLGVFFFFGAVLPLKKIGNIFVCLLASATALLGIVLAGRQAWLQHLPPNQHTDCGANLQYILKVLPPDQAIIKIFQGTAECSQTSWQFMHLSMAEWSLFWFVFFFLLSLLQLHKISRTKNH